MMATKWLYWTCLAVTLSLCLSLFCFNQVARRYPLNYIALFIFTLGSSYILAGVCIFQKPENVVIAAAMTLTVFIGLTLFSFFVNLFTLSPFRLDLS